MPNSQINGEAITGEEPSIHIAIKHQEVNSWLNCYYAELQEKALEFQLPNKRKQDVQVEV